MGSTPEGVRCPISSSLGEFPAFGIDSGVLGFRPYWCPLPFPSPSILGVFHSFLSAVGFQSCFFFTADVSPPIRSISLHEYIYRPILYIYIHVCVCEREYDRQCMPLSLCNYSKHSIKHRYRYLIINNNIIDFYV